MPFKLNTFAGHLDFFQPSGTNLSGLGTDNRIPRWDGVDTLQDSGVTLDDSDNITGLASLTFVTGSTVSTVLDEDDLSSNSDTALATQQSIKSYIDNQDSLTDTLAEILAIGNTTGGTNIVISSGDALTAAVSVDLRLVAPTGQVTDHIGDLLVWHATEAANDFVSISHDATDALVDAGSGDLKLRAGTSSNIEFIRPGTTIVDFQYDGSRFIASGGMAFRVDVGKFVEFSSASRISVNTVTGLSITQWVLAPQSGNFNRGVLFTNFENNDHGLLSAASVFTEPTLIIHSTLDPDTDHSESLWIRHDGFRSGNIVSSSGTMETDRATFDFRIEAVDALPAAVTNQDGASIILEPGASATGGGVDGNVQLLSNVVIGAAAAGVDYTLTFDGETNDGVITWLEDENFLQVGNALGFQRIVTAKTSDDTITVGESNTVFTNEGATGTVILTLPSAVAGLTYEFYIQANETFTITAATGDTIRVTNQVSVTGGTISRNRVGNLVKMVAINSTEWVVETIMGVWTLS